MAKLGEVLGGLVRDVVQARVLADQMACESVNIYAENPLLAAFPVPRVIVKDVSIKLRFAVDKVVEEDLQREAEMDARAAWKQQLSSELLGRAFTSADPAAVQRLTKAIASLPPSDFKIAAALKGDTGPMEKASIALINRQIQRLPVNLRRKLPSPGPNLRKALPTVLNDFLRKVRDSIAAKAASRLELDVFVRKDDLAAVPESGIHEFSFVLAMDDLQVTGQSAATPGTGDK